MPQHYTGYQHQQISQKQYDSKLNFGDPVTIDDGNGNEIIIGYVWEVTSTPTGL